MYFFFAKRFFYDDAIDDSVDQFSHSKVDSVHYIEMLRDVELSLLLFDFFPLLLVSNILGPMVIEQSILGLVSNDLGSIPMAFSVALLLVLLFSCIFVVFFPTRVH